MSRKKRKKIGKSGVNVVYLQSAITTPTICGFRVNKLNHNRLWRWDTLEDVKNTNEIWQKQ